ncbi:hypothetical protein [Burkholderia sp. S-53]|uniref:hypothetical protein n=1 Tax=Burkholderia sp. S-53 TaxID=2906514 RepID=UPI0021D07C48|nr:hypothetical protein [Burkholderia sp. S-53]UXU86563.1 hypothetical protein LXM88_15430 [Burkholderia sp. S-53]
MPPRRRFATGACCAIRSAIQSTKTRSFALTPEADYHIVCPERTQDDPRIVALRGWLADEVAMVRV